MTSFQVAKTLTALARQPVRAAASQVKVACAEPALRVTSSAALPFTLPAAVNTWTDPVPGAFELSRTVMVMSREEALSALNRSAGAVSVTLPDAGGLEGVELHAASSETPIAQ